VAESFFQLRNRARVKQRVYAPREEARHNIFDYIEMCNNPIRKHSNNGLLLPVIFEDKFKKQGA
jgi:putative transposase